jgi:hypothetical protein
MPIRLHPTTAGSRRAERKVGEPTLENEILRVAARKKGLPDPAEEAAEIAMELQAALKTVCRVLDAPRSTIYARRSNVIPKDRAKRGPATELQDDELVERSKSMPRHQTPGDSLGVCIIAR